MIKLHLFVGKPLCLELTNPPTGIESNSVTKIKNLRNVFESKELRSVVKCLGVCEVAAKSVKYK